MGGGGTHTLHGGHHQGRLPSTQQQEEVRAKYRKWPPTILRQLDVRQALTTCTLSPLESFPFVPRPA